MSFARYLGFGDLIMEKLCSVALPNMVNAELRERMSIAQFDAACLSLAQALARNTGVTEISGDISVPRKRKSPPGQTGYGSSSTGDGKAFNPLGRARNIPATEEN